MASINPETAPLKPLLVAFYTGPLAGGAAVCLLGAAPEDVERGVVVLDVHVTEPHVLVAAPSRRVAVTVMLQTCGRVDETSVGNTRPAVLGRRR